MLHEHARRFRRPVGNPDNPEGLFQWMQRYLAHIRARNYTQQTQLSRERYLREFIAWCDSQGLGTPHAVSRHRLEDYLLFVQSYRTRDGRALKWLSKQNKLIPVRAFFRWLAQTGVLQGDPSLALSQGRSPVRLHAHTLKTGHIRRLMSQPDTGSPEGLRDRAMLETLYSTGIRRMELAGLQLQDVDSRAATLFVHQGKGRKDRLVPIGASALHWVNRYVREVRASLAAPDETTLFLTREGRPFSLAWLSTVIGGNVKKAFPQQGGACHLLRHTMATLMLEGGADIRYVQAMLGHAQLTSTQIYTKVSIAGLKAVHARTAPGARRRRRRTRTVGAEATMEGAAAFRARAHDLVDRLPPTANWLDLMQLVVGAALAEGKTFGAETFAANAMRHPTVAD
jgi:integrase/recombinase XerD